MDHVSKGLNGPFEYVEAKGLGRVCVPIRRSHIHRDCLQTGGIPRQVREAAAVTYHFTERTKHKRGARRRSDANRKSKAHPVFKSVQPWSVGPKTESLIKRKAAV